MSHVASLYKAGGVVDVVFKLEDKMFKATYLITDRYAIVTAPPELEASLHEIGEQEW